MTKSAKCFFACFAKIRSLTCMNPCMNNKTCFFRKFFSTIFILAYKCWFCIALNRFVDSHYMRFRVLIKFLLLGIRFLAIRALKRFCNQMGQLVSFQVCFCSKYSFTAFKRAFEFRFFCFFQFFSLFISHC